jgi:predicted MFS family arabinose efflux permease
MGLGLATLVATVPSGMLADRHGYKRVRVYSLLPVPIILLFWPVIGDYLLLMILYMFIVGLVTMNWSIAPAYLMNLTPTLERGFVISISETAVRIGFALGPLIGGYFSYIYSSAAPFYVSSVFFALSFFLILFLRKPYRK